MEKIVFPEGFFNSASSDGFSKIRSSNDAEVFSAGERYFPVMVVETADYKSLDSAMFAKMFNENGYKGNGVYGSVRDYFIESSGGQFKPTFDIYPIKLPKKFSEYNNESLFIVPSLDSLVERKDFKERAGMYEKVIPFIIMHPTSKERALTYNNNFFNYMSRLQYRINRIYSKNGYQFDVYAFIAQKAEGKPDATSSSDVGMLGTCVHEFSHVIGLSDLYSNDSRGYATIGPLPYDVMALGLRNGNGGYPPTFSAFEREAMGWLKPTEIVNRDSVYILKNLSQMQAYAVSNPNYPNEYYIIEYRPAVGFDSKIGSSTYSQKTGKNGVFIWYIDYDFNAFWSNDPNSDESHQRVAVRSVLNKNQEYFTGFDFVNRNGKSSIDGIFNLVFDGDDRVCFTVNRSKSFDKCPEEMVSSSSDFLSSSSIASSSSSLVEQESLSSIVESSNSAIVLDSRQMAPKIHMSVSSGRLDIELSLLGKKTLRFYDALGNLLGLHTFEKSSASIEVSEKNCFVYVQLDVDGTLVFAKRVQFR